MTTTTPWPVPDRRRAVRGFTLVEVMIAGIIGTFLMLGVLTTFLFLGRSGANIANYSEMEFQSRKALEMFAEDTRQASSITWNSSTSVTLIVDAQAITWSYAGGSLSRQTGSATPITMITGITSFAFTAYDITGAQVALSDLTAAGKVTKQLQISLQASRISQTVTTATNLVLSARYILRNKRVTA